MVADLERRYEDVDAGLADLIAVVIAARYRTKRLLTFDERHFRALRPLDGGRFTLLPADAPAPLAVLAVRQGSNSRGSSPRPIAPSEAAWLHPRTGHPLFPLTAQAVSSRLLQRVEPLGHVGIEPFHQVAVPSSVMDTEECPSLAWVAFACGPTAKLVESVTAACRRSWNGSGSRPAASIAGCHTRLRTLVRRSGPPFGDEKIRPSGPGGHLRM